MTMLQGQTVPIEKAIETAPSIIAAVKDPIGLLALMVLAASVLFYLMFRDVHVRVRVALFCAMLLGVAGFAWSYNDAVDKPARPNVTAPHDPDLPGHTGWVFLGYFNATDSTFDAEGPRFTFVRRRDPSGPTIPVKGDIIRLTSTRRIMMKRYWPRRSTEHALDVICFDYDENADDTQIRLPTGTELVVRDVGKGCQDHSESGNMAALWVRIGYPEDSES